MRIMEVDQGSFTPLVFAVAGGIDITVVEKLN